MRRGKERVLGQGDCVTKDKGNCSKGCYLVILTLNKGATLLRKSKGGLKS